MRSNTMKTMFRIFYISILLTILLGISLHFYERVQFHRFIKQNGDYLSGGGIGDSLDLIECRNRLKKLVSDDTSNFIKFNSQSRPLLGYSLSFILKYREVHCGEFTRLLYNVFGYYGIESRPVILFGPDSQLHSVLEVHSPSDGWFLIDTANSPVGFKSYLDSTLSSVYDFKTSKQGYHTASDIDIPCYTQYSYFNIAKTTYGILGITAYIVKPIPGFIVFITQNFYLFWAVSIVLIELVIGSVALLIINLLKKRR